MIPSTLPWRSLSILVSTLPLIANGITSSLLDKKNDCLLTDDVPILPPLGNVSRTISKSLNSDELITSPNLLVPFASYESRMISEVTPLSRYAKVDILLS